MKLIPLTQGKFAQVDDDDYERITKHKWYAGRDHKVWYAQRAASNPTRTIRMHHEVVGRRVQVDHRDGDGLNNQRHNLRECSHSQNQANRRSRGGTSRYRGVCWNKSAGKWQARIKVNGVGTYLGVFASEDDAARAYDNAAIAAWGEFARINIRAAVSRAQAEGER